MKQEPIVKEIEILRSFFGGNGTESPNGICFYKGSRVHVSICRCEGESDSYNFHCSAVHHGGPSFDFDFPLDEIVLNHFDTEDGKCLRVQLLAFVIDFYIKNDESYFIHVCSNKWVKKIVEKIADPPFLLFGDG